MRNMPRKPEPTVGAAGVLTALLCPLFRRFRDRLLFVALALMASDLLHLSLPRYLKTGVDELMQGIADRQRLLALALCMTLTAVAVGLLRYAWRTLLIGFSRHLETALRDQLIAHVLGMDQTYLDRHPPGEIMAHASNDLSAVQLAFGMGLAAAVDVAVMAAIAVFFMLHISPPLTVLAALPLPLLAFSTFFLSRELHRRFERVQAQFSLLTEFARNTLISIRLIKSCTREEQQIREFGQLGQEYVSSNIRAAMIHGLLMPLAMLTGSIGTLLVLYSGGGMVIRKEITLGDFVAFITYFAMLSLPLATVGWSTSLIRRGLTSLARISRLLEAGSAVNASLRTTTQPVILQSRPHISLRRLNFSYPGTITPALRDIDLEIGPGVFGITGRTGSGKSTLCRLLLRQYPIADGSYLFAGHDVNQLDTALIWRHVSWVDRNTALFSGTAAENISLAKPDAPLEDIMAAAKLAAVHDEIMAMPEGYQTRIGEKGLRLSGGQKQRFAIARALLADRPILILDDALSALDAETATAVFARLCARQRSRTLLVVSHHVQLLAHADHILLLDQGSVAAQGSHAVLMARNAYYQDAARRQGKEDADARIRLF